jgi:hypothetical protein
MARVHSALNRFASAAGLAPSEVPPRHAVSLVMSAGVLAAVVGVVAVYAGVRELSQPAGDERQARAVQRLASAPGSDLLLSIEDINKLADQD